MRLWYLRGPNLMLKTSNPDEVLRHVQQGWKVITRAEFESVARRQLDPEEKKSVAFTIPAKVREQIREQIRVYLEQRA